MRFFLGGVHFTNLPCLGSDFEERLFTAAFYLFPINLKVTSFDLQMLSVKFRSECILLVASFSNCPFDNPG